MYKTMGNEDISMEMITTALYLLGGLFTLMMSFYLALCFVCWAGDMIEKIIERKK